MTLRAWYIATSSGSDARNHGRNNHIQHLTAAGFVPSGVSAIVSAILSVYPPACLPAFLPASLAVRFLPSYLGRICLAIPVAYVGEATRVTLLEQVLRHPIHSVVVPAEEARKHACAGRETGGGGNGRSCIKQKAARGGKAKVSPKSGSPVVAATAQLQVAKEPGGWRRKRPKHRNKMFSSGWLSPPSFLGHMCWCTSNRAIGWVASRGGRQAGRQAIRRVSPSTTRSSCCSAEHVFGEERLLAEERFFELAKTQTHTVGVLTRKLFVAMPATTDVLSLVSWIAR